MAFKKRTIGTQLHVSMWAIGQAFMESISGSLERSVRAMAILLIMAGDVEENPGPLPPASASPESMALRRHSASLITAIADPLMLSWKLFSAGIIDIATKDKANLPTMTTQMKNDILLSVVMSRVDTDSSLFHQFVDLLKNDGEDILKSLGAKLEGTYNRITKGDIERCTLNPPLSKQPKLSPIHIEIHPSQPHPQPSHLPSQTSPQPLHHPPQPSTQPSHHPPQPSPQPSHHPPQPSPQHSHHPPQTSPQHSHHPPQPSPQPSHSPSQPSPQPSHHPSQFFPQMYLSHSQPPLYHDPLTTSCIFLLPANAFSLHPNALSHPLLTSSFHKTNSPPPPSKQIECSTPPSTKQIESSLPPPTKQIKLSPPPSTKPIKLSPPPSMKQIECSPSLPTKQIKHSLPPPTKEIEFSPSSHAKQKECSPPPPTRHVKHSPSPLTEHSPRFLDGITKYQGATVKEHECEKAMDGSLKLSSYTLQLLHESGDYSIIKGHKSYYCKLTDLSPLLDFSILGHCIANSSYKWILDLGGFGQHMQSTNRIATLVQALESNSSPSYTIEKINCFYDSPECVQHLLLKLPRYALQQIQILMLVSNSGNPQSLPLSLYEHILSKMSRLNELSVWYVPITTTVAVNMADFIIYNNTLRKVELVSNAISAEGREALEKIKEAKENLELSIITRNRI